MSYCPCFAFQIPLFLQDVRKLSTLLVCETFERSLEPGFHPGQSTSSYVQNALFLNQVDNLIINVSLV